MISGIKEIMDRIKKAQDATREECRKVVDEGARLIEARAKIILESVDWIDAKGAARVGHIDTGNLERSIKHTTWFSEKYVIEASVGTGVDYAPYVEGMQGGGFLYPAFNEVYPKIRQMIYDKCKETLGL